MVVEKSPIYYRKTLRGTKATIEKKKILPGWCETLAQGPFVDFSYGRKNTGINDNICLMNCEHLRTSSQSPLGQGWLAPSRTLLIYSISLQSLHFSRHCFTSFWYVRFSTWSSIPCLGTALGWITRFLCFIDERITIHSSFIENLEYKCPFQLKCTSENSLDCIYITFYSVLIEIIF